MKILYLISCINYKSKGNGGHYYDLISTVKEISRIHSVRVITVGTEVPIAISNSKIEFDHITVNKFNFLAALFRLRKLLKVYGIEIIHSFDDNAYYFARLSTVFAKINNVLTLPGGKNPTLFYPLSPNLILFSKENYAFFSEWKKYTNSNIAYIPNRVMPVKQDIERIEEIKNNFNINNYEHVFLRITRITNYNYWSIIQSIELVKYLISKNYNACLIVIGVVEDQKLYHGLTNGQIPQVIFITEDRYTINANELIDVADFVVGTGRGFMEAALQNKVLLAPCSNSTLPILADKNTIEDLFKTNFSQRFTATDEIIHNSISQVCECLSCSESKIGIVNYLSSYANKYFTLTNVIEKYSAFYESLNDKGSFGLSDVSFHTIIFFKRLFFN